MAPELRNGTRPDDDGFLLIDTGLRLGNRKVVICTEDLDGAGTEHGIYIPAEETWEPDEDGEPAAICPKHDAPHWLIDLVTALRDGYATFSEANTLGDSVIVSLGSLLAEQILERVPSTELKAGRGANAPSARPTELRRLATNRSVASQRQPAARHRSRRAPVNQRPGFSFLASRRRWNFPPDPRTL